MIQVFNYKCPNCSAGIDSSSAQKHLRCEYCGSPLLKVAAPVKEQARTISVSFERDDLYVEALMIVIDMGRASSSILQRRLSIGYGRATTILDQMEQDSLIAPANGSAPRKVCPAAYELAERIKGQIQE